MENGERPRSTINVFSAAALIIASITMAICVSIRSEIKSGAISKYPNNDINVSNTDIEEAKYITEIENGYVVIKSVSGEKICVLNVPIKLMSVADREYFEAGVSIFSDTELEQLINDFS